MSPSELCAATVRLQAALLARAGGKEGGPTEGELGRELSRVRQQLAQDDAQIAGLTGRRLLEPPNLPDRFRQGAVLPAIRAALAQASPGAEVTSIDCLEYPCLAYGPGLTEAQSDALKGAMARAGYAHDSVSIVQLNGLSAVVVTPPDDLNGATPADAQNAMHRVIYRFQQMWDSTQGQ